MLKFPEFLFPHVIENGARSWHYLVRGSRTQANSEEMLMVGGKMLKGSLIHLQDSFA